MNACPPQSLKTCSLVLIKANESHISRAMKKLSAQICRFVKWFASSSWEERDVAVEKKLADWKLNQFLAGLIFMEKFCVWCKYRSALIRGLSPVCPCSVSVVVLTLVWSVPWKAPFRTPVLSCRMVYITVLHQPLGDTAEVSPPKKKKNQLLYSTLSVLIDIVWS